MLIAAFVILGAAALLGSALATMHLRTERATTVPWPLGALHGLLGISGLACLVLALRGPPRGLTQGTASFGTIGAALIALAVLFAGGILAKHLLSGRRAGLLIGIHATLAVSGFVVLAAYIFAG